MLVILKNAQYNATNIGGEEIEKIIREQLFQNMKKRAMQFLVIFLIANLHAFDARWKSVQDIDLSETVGSDPNYLLSVQKFELKNNCSLIIRPMLEMENESESIFTQIYLESNGNLLLLLDHKDSVTFFYSAPKYLFRYDNIDFDNYFCLTQYSGGYYYHYLFDKRNGEMLLNEFIGTADLNHNILFYLNENDEMILYDLNANEKYNIDKYLGYGKGNMGYWEKFKIVDITKENYLVLFWGNLDQNGDEIPLLINVPK